MLVRISKRLLFIVAILIVVSVAGYMLYLIRAILPPFIIALVIAYLLNPVVKKLGDLKVPRVLAIILVYSAVITVVVILALYGVPKVVRELNRFADAIPYYTQQVQEYLRSVRGDYSRSNIPESIKQVTDETLADAEDMLIAAVQSVADSIIGLFSQVLSVIIAPVLAFYMLKDWETLGRYTFSLLPTGWREEAAFLFHEIDVVLTKFIRGHLLVAFTVGTLTALGLASIRMKFALLLGIVAGIADIIPYFGPIIGAVPAVALALLQSKYQAFYAVGVMVIVQQLESNIISPKILGDSLGLHPLVIIFVLLAGGELFGIVGMLLAVPVTAVSRILLSYFFNRWNAAAG
ncbi:AI-2E family transporter [Metallumcola ferriviriculae]|uniref:AI-2E family transporter n=1 Tax=Metallumcola ferriviriculae TaxID=3039180 RepID=A0AAU0URI9_9FIRM|nr:AI-2E family transporter [Desulfitibacteraceae bacterium MK1]